MANEQIYIEVKTKLEGIKSLSEQMRILNAIIKDSETNVKKLTKSSEAHRVTLSVVEKTAKDLNVGYVNTVNLQDKIYNSSQRVAQGWKGMATALNNQLHMTRQAQVATYSLSQAIQDAPYGIRGMANNIEYLFQQLIQLRTTAGSTALAIKGFASGLMGIGGVYLVFSVFSAVINYLSGIKKESKNASVGIDELRQSLARLTTMQQFRKFDFLDEIIEKLETQKIERGFRVDELGGDKTKDAVYQMIEARIAAYRLERSALLDVMDADRERDAQARRSAAEKKKRDKEEKGGVEELYHPRLYGEPVKMDVAGLGVIKGKGKLLEAEGGLIRMQVQLKGIKDAATEARRELNIFEQSVVSGMQQVGNAIHKGIYDAFERSFKGVNSLLEIFLAEMASKLAQSAMLSLFASMFPALAPALGFASVATNASPRIISTGSEGRLSGAGMEMQSMANAIRNIHLTTEISSTKLAIAVDGGNRLREQRLF